MGDDPLRLYARFQAQINGLNPVDYEKQLDAESSFNPAALSPKGARGVAQFMPATGRQYGLYTIDDLHDPIKSIGAGAKYMADLKAQANGDEQAARVGYNAGPQAMKRYQSGKAIPSETNNYLATIGGDDPESLYQKFQSQLAATPPVQQPKQAASLPVQAKPVAQPQFDPSDQTAAQFEVLKRQGNLADTGPLKDKLKALGWEVGDDYVKPPAGVKTPLWDYQIGGRGATVTGEASTAAVDPRAQIGNYVMDIIKPLASMVGKTAKASAQILGMGELIGGTPAEGAKELYQQFGAPQVDQLKQAYQLWEERGGGDIDPEIAAHALAGVIPMFGPMAATAGQQLGQGDIRGFSQSAIMLALPAIFKAMKAGLPVKQAVKQVKGRLALPSAPVEAQAGPFTAGPEGIAQAAPVPRGQVEPFVGTREPVTQQPRIATPQGRGLPLGQRYRPMFEGEPQPEPQPSALSQAIASAPPRLTTRPGAVYEPQPRADIQDATKALIEKHGTDLSLSNARSVFPEVQGPTGEVDPKLLAERGLGLTERAQQVQDAGFREQLKNSDVKEVEFVVGGTSSGKTTGTVPTPERLIYESHLSDPNALMGLIKEADAAGKKTFLTGVYRDPERAYRDGIKRFKSTGKVVPSDYAAQTHADFSNNYQPFIQRLQDEGLSTDVRTIDNSKGKMAMAETTPDKVKPVDQGQLQRVFQGVVDESKLSAADRARFAPGQQAAPGNEGIRGERRQAGEVPQEAPQGTREAAQGQTTVVPTEAKPAAEIANEQIKPTQAAPPSPRPETARQGETEARPMVAEPPVNQQAEDVVTRITSRTDHPASSLPDLQDQLNAAGIPMHEQVDILNRAGFNFKDTFQLGGAVRAMRAEAAGETLPMIQHKRFGPLAVLGKTVDNNRLIVIDKDGTVRGTQNPLGLSGNQSIKAYRTADLEKLPTVSWAELGLQSEAWPTKAQLDVLGKLTGKAYGPHLSDVPDDVLKAIFPEAYKRRLAGADFQPKAMDAMQDIATSPIPENAPQWIKDAYDRLHAKQQATEAGELKEFGSGGPATRDLIDSAIVHGYQVYSSVKNFGAWGARMVEKFGEDIKPHLRAIWNQVVQGSQPRAQQPTAGAQIGAQPNVPPPVSPTGAGQPPVTRAPTLLRKTGDFLRMANIGGLLTARGWAKIVTGMGIKSATDSIAGSMDGMLDAAFSKATGTPRMVGGLTPQGIFDAAIRTAKQAPKEALAAIRSEPGTVGLAVHKSSGNPVLDYVWGIMPKMFGAKEAVLRTKEVNEYYQKMARAFAQNDVKDGVITKDQLDAQTEHYVDNPPPVVGLNGIVINHMAEAQAVYDEQAGRLNLLNTEAAQSAWYATYPGDLLSESAKRSAEQAVYAQPTSVLARMERGVSKAMKDIGPEANIPYQIAKGIFMPVFKRPANAITDYFKTYVGAPINIPVQGIRAVMDPLDPIARERFVKSASKGMVGWGLIGVGAALNKAGILTGMDDEEHPGSLLINGQYYPIYKIPFAGWLPTLGATLSSVGISGVPAAVGKQIMDHPLVRTAETLGRTAQMAGGLIKGQDKAAGQIAGLVGDVASRAIPAPVAMTAEAMDAQERQRRNTETPASAFLTPSEYRLPWLRQGLPAEGDKSRLSVINPLYSPADVRGQTGFGLAPRPPAPPRPRFGLGR